MENAPVIWITAQNEPHDIRERVKMWSHGAYYPLYLKASGLTVLRECKIFKQNPLYGEDMTIFCYENAQARAKSDLDPDRQATIKDVGKSFPTVERVWRVAYMMLRSFKNSSIPVNTNADAADGSIIHLEALRLSPEEQEKCNEWFVKWAYRVYIPVLMKLPGLIEYSRYRWMPEVKPWGEEYIGKTLETEYPTYLSILYFENLKAWENYENSPELVSFKRALESDLAITMNYRWNVQYQLLKNWRK